MRRDDAILARWPGRCPYCGRAITRGDLIVKVAGQWLHDDCDRAALRPTDDVVVEHDDEDEGGRE